MERTVVAKWTGIPGLNLGTLCVSGALGPEKGWVVEPLVPGKLLFKRLTLCLFGEATTLLTLTKTASNPCSYHHCTLAGRKRSLSWDPTKPSSRRKPQKGWTYQALDRFFGGSLTEAASHLTTNVCNSYLDPAKNNPLSPVPRLTRSRQYRLATDTNPQFLDSPEKMRENRCSRCHRYKKDSPCPDVGHEGSQGESKCKLDHHPPPCDYLEEDGSPCTAHTSGDSNAAAIAQDAAAKAMEMEGKFTAQTQEMIQLRAEMSEMRQMMGSMRMTANPGASLAATSSQSGSATLPTTSLVAPRVSLLQPQTTVAVTGQGVLLSEAQNLIQLNDRGGVAGNNLQGYTGPTMKDLQHDNSIAEEVQRQLSNLIANTPALQKVVAGQSATPSLPVQNPQSKGNRDFGGQNLGAQGLGTSHTAFQAIQSGAGLDVGGAAGGQCQPREDLNLLDMDSMLGLTVREKQYRPHEFASRGNFFYAKSINDRNITLPLYVYGYLKHCVILQSGLVPVAEGEIMARLVNLMNIMEITSNNSTLNDFEHPAWQLGKGYGDRLFNDIQQGHRNWLDLPNNILPDVFLHVKDMVDMQTRKKDTNQPRGRGRGRGKGSGQERSTSDKSGGEKPLVCSTYNDFFTGSGCAYEHNNQRKCSYEHYCSKCFASTGNKVGHKGRFCTDSSSGAPVTTTSG